jgi:hypothetical protein
MAHRKGRYTLRADERKVLKALSKTPTEFWAIVEKAGLPANRTVGALMQLEIKRAISRFPGQRFSSKPGISSNPSWTRQHFVLVARVLSSLRADAADKGAVRTDFEVLDIVTRDFAYALAQTNPKFNMSTFLKASGYGKRGM